MGVEGLEAEHGEGFRGSVADGLADPADELDAALGGPPGGQNQGREGAAGRRTLPGQSGDPFGSALVLGLVADAVLPFQGVLAEQEQIVGNREQLGLRLLDHQAGGPGFFLPQLVLEVIEHLLSFPPPAIDFHDHAGGQVHFVAQSVYAKSLSL